MKTVNRVRMTQWWRWLVSLCVMPVLLAAFSLQAQTRPAERRVALVVGNAAYKASPLKNPANDARAIAAALRRHGFEVIERQNVTRESLALAAREFGDRLKGANVGLFYFAGHGMQVRNRNFLVPVDADIARADEVPYRAIDVNEVLDKMDSARTPINIVLLDACRNNPFARSFRLTQAGLAQMEAPAGTLIGFATAPGSVASDGDGENGLYTSALLQHMDAPALPIEQMLKRVRVDVARKSNNSQVPWESSSLDRDFVFAAASAPTPSAPAAAAPPAPAPVTELAIDLAFWDAIKSSTQPADYKAYLQQHPNGRFAALARLRSGEPGTVAPAMPGSTGASQSATPALTNLPKVASPEGLYFAIPGPGQVTLTDLRGTSLRQFSLPEPGGASFETLRFSPDGRWLLASGSRRGLPTQWLLAVSDGAVIWERAGASAEFDRERPLVRLVQAGGQSEAIALGQGK